MRRAIDIAKYEIEQLTNRDAILDRFFVYASDLFKFTVLFLVRGDVAHGRNAEGLGAPAALVTRLAIPLNEPGLLAQALITGKPYLASTSPSGADSILVGTLGRAMPSALVAPIRVRDRAVAILVGEGASDTLTARATGIGRAPLDLAKEELLILTAAVGDGFERMIVRRKTGASSIPPPAFMQLDGGAPFPQAPPLPGSFASARPPAMSAPPAPASPAAPAPSGRRKIPTALLAALGSLAVAGLAGTYLLVRPEAGPQSLVVKADKLPGFPNVDPTALLDAARSASGLGSNAELVSLQGEPVNGGKVSLAGAGAPTPISFTFATQDTEAEVRVDAAGIHGPQKRARSRCGDEPCRPSVPAPQCSFAQIWDAAKSVGLRDGESASISYASSRRAANEAEPEWFTKVAGRGAVRFTAACKPLPRQRFLPIAIALDALPEAPSVDPLKLLPIAREQSGLEADAVLLEIEARGVGTDGRVNLGVGDRGIIFTFTDPDSVPAAQRRWRQVTVGAQGIPMVSPDFDREPLPLRFRGAVVPPRCTFERVWKILGHIPRDLTGRVTYGRDNTGAASEIWTIEVPTMSVRQTTSDRVCAAW